MSVSMTTGFGIVLLWLRLKRVSNHVFDSDRTADRSIEAANGRGRRGRRLRVGRAPAQPDRTIAGAPSAQAAAWTDGPWDQHSGRGAAQGLEAAKKARSHDNE